MSAMEVIKCPAKINLYLDVLGRYQDGFHEIETLMAPISLFDEIRVSPRNKGPLEFSCSDPRIPQDHQNLVLQAVRQIEQYTQRSFSAAIHLEKNIPSGAGLGGGSSNAAAMTLFLNQHYHLGLTYSEMGQLLAAISKDAPFFLANKVAWCLGKGDEIHPVSNHEGMENSFLTLLIPPVKISTAWAYGAIDRKLLTGRQGRVNSTYSAYAQGFDLSTFSVSNFFEKVVFVEYPQLQKMRDFLLKVGATQAGMSGSGSVIFGVFRGQRLWEDSVGAVNKVYPDLRVERATFLTV